MRDYIQCYFLIKDDSNWIGEKLRSEIIHIIITSVSGINRNIKIKSSFLIHGPFFPA
jgi:hypothetical protein